MNECFLFMLPFWVRYVSSLIYVQKVCDDEIKETVYIDEDGDFLDRYRRYMTF